MKSDERRFSGEPTLDEMLADPIVQLLMEHDGLSEQAVRKVFEAAAKRMRRRSDGLTEAA